jgi:hypothetical protein
MASSSGDARSNRSDPVGRTLPRSESTLSLFVNDEPSRPPSSAEEDSDAEKLTDAEKKALAEARKKEEDFSRVRGEIALQFFFHRVTPTTTAKGVYLNYELKLFFEAAGIHDLSVPVQRGASKTSGGKDSGSVHSFLSKASR